MDAGTHKNLKNLGAIKSEGCANSVGAGSKPAFPVMTRQPRAGLEPAPTNAC